MNIVRCSPVDFSGIYFPQMAVRYWSVLSWKNRRLLSSLCSEAFQDLRTHRRAPFTRREDTA
jgi:hypothetical protein